jgi:N-acetyltransferase 10
MSLLSYDSFKKLDSATALSIIDATTSRHSRSTSTTTPERPRQITSEELNNLLTPFDMKRLTSYTDSMIDYHVILDLLPPIAQLYFSNKLGPDLTLSAAQQAILLALGLQRKPVEVLESELGLGASQSLALFAKVMRRIGERLNEIRKAGVGRDLPVDEPIVKRKGLLEGASTDGAGIGNAGFEAVDETVEQELSGDVKRAREVQRELLDSMDMEE